MTRETKLFMYLHSRKSPEELVALAARLGFGALDEADLRLLAIYYEDMCNLVDEVRDADVTGYEPLR